MKNSKSFSVLFWTNKAKAGQNGLVPLYARVTVDGKRAEISLKKKLSLKKWDARSGFMKGSGDEVRITNRYINEVSNDLFEIFAGLNKSGAIITADEIKNKFIGQVELPPPSKTLLEAFDEHNRDVESLIGKDYVKGTLTKYKTIRGKLSPDEKQQLQIDIKYFFVNYPPKELRGVIWELYKGWAINSAEGASKDDITDMILFYDACRTFMEDVYIMVTQSETGI